GAGRGGEEAPRKRGAQRDPLFHPEFLRPDGKELEIWRSGDSIRISARPTSPRSAEIRMLSPDLVRVRCGATTEVAPHEPQKKSPRPPRLRVRREAVTASADAGGFAPPCTCVPA